MSKKSKKGKESSDGGGDQPKEVSEALSNAMLRQMVEELQQTKLKLVLNIKELQDANAQQRADHEDIYYYLNKKCDDSFEVISSLEEQILAEQASREVAEKGFEKKIEELKTKFGFEESRYLARITELEDKSKALKEFGERRDEMEKNLEKLMRTLDEERVAYRQSISDLENKSIYERETLRKDFERKVEAVRKEVELSLEEQLPEKAKKTQIAFNRIRTEMKYQSRQADKVLEVSKYTLDQDSNLKLELSLAKSQAEECILRLSKYQKTIRHLNEQVASMQAAADTEAAAHAQDLKVKDDEIARLRQRLEDIQSRGSVENAQLDEVWQTLSTVYAAEVLRAKRSFGFSTSLPNKKLSSRKVDDDRENVLLTVITAMVKKYPSKFPMSLFFEAEDVEQARQQRDASASISPSVLSSRPRSKHGLNSERMFPPLQNTAGGLSGIESWDGPFNLQFSKFGQMQPPKSKTCSVGVQTEYSSSSSRPGSKAARRAPRLTDSPSSMDSLTHSMGSVVLEDNKSVSSSLSAFSSIASSGLPTDMQSTQSTTAAFTGAVTSGSVVSYPVPVPPKVKLRYISKQTVEVGATRSALLSEKANRAMRIREAELEAWRQRRLSPKRAIEERPPPAVFSILGQSLKTGIVPSADLRPTQPSSFQAAEEYPSDTESVASDISSLAASASVITDSTNVNRMGESSVVEPLSPQSSVGSLSIGR